MKILYLLIAICSIWMLHQFCENKTQGFRLHTILSNLPNDPSWNTPPLSSDEMAHVQTLLEQPFTYLGHGGWCYAFLGADQKTVLKFFKHDHLSLKHILRHFSFPKLLLRAPTLDPNSYYFQRFNFTSCSLMQKHLKARTGLIYLHLNKTPSHLPTATLYDPIGIRHTIDLNQTEFILQHKAEFLFARIDRLQHEGDIEGAKRAIDQMLYCLLDINQAGIQDLDHRLYENYGFVEEQAITVDLSSFVSNQEMKRPGVYKKELICKTRRLTRYLKKHHPELYHYCEEKLNEILEQNSA